MTVNRGPCNWLVPVALTAYTLCKQDPQEHTHIRRESLTTNTVTQSRTSAQMGTHTVWCVQPSACARQFWCPVWRVYVVSGSIVHCHAAGLDQDQHQHVGKTIKPRPLHVTRGGCITTLWWFNIVLALVTCAFNLSDITFCCRSQVLNQLYRLVEAPSSVQLPAANVQEHATQWFKHALRHHVASV